MSGNQKQQVDQLDRIAADADSAARALTKQTDMTVALLQHVICSDVLPIVKALAAEVGDRDADLDERVTELETGIETALDAIMNAQRAKVIDILQRAVLLGEEVCATVLAPSDAMKAKARLLTALATETLSEIETVFAPEAEDTQDDDESGEREVADGEAS